MIGSRIDDQPGKRIDFFLGQLGKLGETQGNPGETSGNLGKLRVAFGNVGTWGSSGVTWENL